MKLFINNLLKYLLLLILIFLFIFLFTFLYSILPYFKIPKDEIYFTNYLKTIYNLCLFNSLFNSFIISFIFFNIFILNRLKKIKIITFFIPLFITSIIIPVLFITLKPDLTNFNSYNINDARLFFPEKTFFTYEHLLEEKIEQSLFINSILNKIDNIDEKNFIDNIYIKDNLSNYYYLKKTDFDKKHAIDILTKIGYFKEIKLFFEKIEKNKILNIIILKDDKVFFKDQINVYFSNDYILLKNIIDEKDLRFKKIKLLEFEIHNLNFIKILFNKFNSISLSFFRFNNYYLITLFWFSIGFLLLSINSIINIKLFPFMNLILYFFIYSFFYIYFDNIIDILNKYIINFVKNFNKNLLIIFIVICFGIFTNLINLLFIKTTIWEKK